MSKCAPGEWLHSLRRAGGPGGRHAVKLGAHCESEHAHHTTRVQKQLYARYNWRRGGVTLAGDTWANNLANAGGATPADTRAEPLEFAAAGDTRFPRGANKRFCEGAAWDCLRGAARKSNRGRSQARPRRNRPTRHQGTPEKSARPGWDYITTYGLCILFLIHWQH